MGNTSKVQKCTVCGKVLTTPSAIANGCGALCAKRQKQTNLVAHKKRFTLQGIPAGYIKTTIVHKMHIVPAKANGLNVSVSKFVKAFGGDTGSGNLAHPICRFYYVAGAKARYIHPYIATPAGLQALATGNWANAPKPPTKTQLVKGIKANKVFYTG